MRKIYSERWCFLKLFIISCMEACSKLQFLWNLLIFLIFSRSFLAQWNYLCCNYEYQSVSVKYKDKNSNICPYVSRFEIHQHLAVLFVFFLTYSFVCIERLIMLRIALRVFSLDEDFIRNISICAMAKFNSV